jgi:nucleoid DNA-binding protein
MSVTPPINLRELAKKGVLDEARFFRMLSEQNNYVDKETVRDFYMGLVRLITKELRDNGVARLPHLGDFALVRAKDRMGWAGKTWAMLEGKYVLKFYPFEKWRKYFSKLSERSGLEGALDPREKVLGATLDEYGVGE